MEKISVIVPAYNSEKTIERCLDSLINQTYDNIEIIVINDGSFDNTLELLNKYKKANQNKIKIISRENKGIGYSRNEGIKNASGKYIGFVDSDDYVEKDMYEKMLKKLKEDDSDIVVCDYYEFGSFSKRIFEIQKFKPSGISNNPNIIKWINTSPWNKLYKKELLQGISFPTDMKYEDMPFVMNTLIRAKKISKLNLPLYNYYFNPIGETGTINYHIFDIFESLQLTIDAFDKKDKRINRQLKIMTCEKIFPYIIALYDFKNRQIMLRFIDKTYDFLKKNFGHWRCSYIGQFNNIKNLLVRILQSQKWVYKNFVKKRVPKTKKEIILTSYNLEIGGVEKALVNLVNNFDYDKYDITLLLQHKEGPLLANVDNRVWIKDYGMINSKFVIYRKLINLLRIIKTIIACRNKYDFSGCFGTGYKSSSLVALYASKNSASWMHTNIQTFIKNKYSINDKKQLKLKIDKFLNNIKFRKFNNYLFVSNNAIDSFLKLYPNDKDKCYLCYNFVDYKDIIEKSKMKIKEKKSKGFCIVNISRHTEFDKRLSRLIEAVSLCKNKDLIKLYLVGDGADHQKYINLVNELKLEKQVFFLGNQSNPYPYYLLGDVFVLTSDFEGFPTVYTEALTLGIPIITTDVSDANLFIKDKYGLVCQKNSKSVAETIDKFFEKKFKIKAVFDPNKFNEISMNTLERIINNE